MSRKGRQEEGNKGEGGRKFRSRRNERKGKFKKSRERGARKRRYIGVQRREIQENKISL